MEAIRPHPGLAWSLIAALMACPAAAAPQDPAPAGLARSALANPAFTWVRESAPGLRLYFDEGSYPWRHRDRLVEATEAALAHDLGILGADRPDAPIDVFFIESRAQMDSLVGHPVTGFAHRDARAVFLVTNPTWRSFERHELMHVLAYHEWGPPAEPAAWIEEGLAQFADGRCGDYTVHSVARAMVARDGAIPLDTLARRFRQLDDLRPYLQAASMIGWLYETRGRDTVQALWTSGLDAMLPRLGVTAGELTGAWLEWVESSAPDVPSASIARIEAKGCG